MRASRVFAIVLAGGEGKRLAPLTADRAKPAVPFGGNYRLIDFALSNLVNAGQLKIAVLTQYKSESLGRHIATTWRLSPLLGNYVTPVPAQMRRGPNWFAGSADAIYQNLNLIYDERPNYICVFGADHVFRMDPRQMLEQHIALGSGLTIAGIRVPIESSREFGVIETDSDSRTIRAFREKPSDPVGMTESPGEVLASMGNYVFSADVLIDAVIRDAADETSAHDIGGNIIPDLVERGQACVWDFANSKILGASERDLGYWRDVGTLDAYYDAHMDLISVDPMFNLYNEDWPILTWPEQLPPAKFVFEEEGRIGAAMNSMVCAGVVVSGGTVRRSILSPGVHVHSQALVEGSVVMHDADIGRGAIVRNAILDKNVRIAPGARVGVDPAADKARFPVSPNGIVVIKKGAQRRGMKVALLTREYPPNVYGGAGVHVEYLARELARSAEVTVHCWGDDRPPSPAARPSSRTGRGRRSPGRSPTRAALEAFSIDLTMAAGVAGAELVHSHTWYANLGGHLAKLVHGIPHVATVHSLEPMRPWKQEQLGGGYALSSFAERTALEAADAIVAVSAAHLAEILTCYPAVDPARTSVIYNGIDAEEYRPDPRHRRARAARDRPRAPVGRLRRPDHAPEGARRTCSKPRRRSSRTPSSCSAPERPTRRRSPSRPRPGWTRCGERAAT